MNKILLITAVLFGLSACGNQSLDVPLVFYQQQTVGIGITSAPNPSITLGYSDVNGAIIPVTNAGEMLGGSQCAFSPTPAADGDYQMICDQDTLAVFGQFEIDVDIEGSIGIGKVFSTGHAAITLTEAIKEKASSGNE